jgi:gamma-glutamyl-gamma-aminobutyrate hydrolase PuuD
MAEEEGFQGDPVKAICALLEARGPSFSVLERVQGHYSTFPHRGQEDMAKHDVSIVPGTILHRLVGRSTIRGASFHNLQVPPSQKYLTINAWSADGVVEGVEYADHILGVQFHPELDDTLPEIFSFLTQA